MAPTRVRPELDPASVDALVHLPDAELVRSAAGLFDRATRTIPGPQDLAVDYRTGEVIDLGGGTAEGPRFGVIVSAGTVQLRAQDESRWQRRVGGTPLEAAPPDPALNQPRVHDVVYGEAAYLTGHEGPSTYAGRGSTVSEWSRKSRRNMVRVLGTLDYRPLFDGGVPGLLTLTLPDDWETVAPDGATFAGYRRAFQERFFRRFGRRMVGIWKVEFQRRGAPHYHVLLTVPYHDAQGVPVSGRIFELWAAEAWAAVVDHPDPGDRILHGIFGARLDMREGARMRDVRRIASYFVKHSLKGSGRKEYQHRVPDLWREPGSGPGRFWGFVGLRPVSAGVEVDVRDFVKLRRLLRRYGKSRGLKLCVSGRLFGGWVVTRDGPAFASMLARALAL